MLDLDAIRKRNQRRIWCEACNGNGCRRVGDSSGKLVDCPRCDAEGYLWVMDDDVAAMLAELERLYAAPVAEPVQEPTPGARAAAIAGELRRMVTKPRGGVTYAGAPSEEEEASFRERCFHCTICKDSGYSVHPMNGWKAGVRCPRGCPVDCGVCDNPNCDNPNGQH